MPGNSTNKLPTIDIQGKKYVLVSDRVLEFNRQNPEGSITTELISDPDSSNIIVKATVMPDNKLNSKGEDIFINRRFTGYSQATKGEGMVNKTAALENAETSAVGRALAFMGIGVIDSIASVDEVNKAKGGQTPPKESQSKSPATPKQKILMNKLYLELGGEQGMLPDYIDKEGYDHKTLTSEEASIIIAKLMMEAK